jgi:hypothetical protein
MDRFLFSDFKNEECLDDDLDYDLDDSKDSGIYDAESLISHGP